MKLLICLHYNVHYVNQHYFSNANQMIYGTNVFSIYGGPLWEANIDAQFILNPYVVAYCTSYLTKVDNFIKCEM